MKRLITIFSALLLLMSIHIHAQTTISSVFVTIPDHLLVGMDVEKRNELLLLPDSASIIVENVIKEDVERTALKDDYIALKTSEAGTLEIKLLPLVNSTDIIAVITTVCGPACDSRVDFYTTSWKPLDGMSDLFPEKDKNWFLNQASDDTDGVKNAYAVLDMTPIKLSFEEGGSDIKAEYDIENYLTGEDYQTLERYLIKKPLVFKWDKLSYKR